jgi:hypothetical protein
LDSDFRGQIGYVDFRIQNTIKIIGRSEEPVVKLGSKGSFSEYGTGLGTTWPKENPEKLLFIGFSRPEGFKFKAFSGTVDFSQNDWGFANTEKYPLFDDRLGGSTIVGVHDVIEFEGFLYFFVSIGNGFEVISGKEFPRYEVSLFRSKSFSDLSLVKHRIAAAEFPTYRIGRPQIYRTDKGFEMIVTAGTINGSYEPRVFYSKNLVDWEENAITTFSENRITGVDDLHQCYLSRFQLSGREFIFYNGNNMGVDGLALAEGVEI